MARNRNLKDGAVLGGMVGAVVAFPQIGESIIKFIENSLPEVWFFAGSASVPIYLIASGVLIGLIIDRT